MASEQNEGEMSEISSLTDSSDEGKKVIEEVVETVEEADKPAYSEEDLDTLVGFIRGMIILFDYEDEDFNEEVVEVIKLWLTDANNPLLFIFYDGNRLSCSLAFPLCPINDIMYFMREQDQLFSALERFHDDILFGTLHGDIEGSLLLLLEQVYGPMIFSNVDWSENVKANVVNGFNAFMTYLTELHYKLSGFTLLYVPREGSDMEVQEVVLNRSMIKRLEAVVIDWTGQIRATLSDTQHFVPDDLVCPSDEYSFWLYRHEVLSAIRLQYKGSNVQHIIRILEFAQSLYVKHLKDVLLDLDKEIEIAESNIPFLKLLVDPCFAIGSLETADDFCSQLIYVMHIIRFIGQDSTHLNKDESITKLFLYLSNEIVACCMRGIDVGRILAGAPRYGIEICKMKVNCCESYKIIYEEMLEHFKEEFPWNLDYAAIFNRINAFLQRIHDIVEICDAMLIFGKYAESTAYTSYRFFCNNAQEFERRCDQVEQIFHNNLKTIESVGGTILDINNKEWYRHIGEFRETLKCLDDIIENLLSNVFLMSENLEEKLNVLVTMLNFYKRENIRESFMRKISEVWSIFNNEIVELSKDISAGTSQYPALLPPHAGRYAVLKMRFEHLTHLRTLIVNCRFFPECPQQEEVLALYEACEKQVKGAQKGYYDAWCKSITSDMASWYQRNLICRSHLRPGLFEVNIERRLLMLFDEAHNFKTLGINVPLSMDLDKHENTRLTFDNVLRLVLYFNGVVSGISDKERLFFKPMIQQTERKLEPLRSKLTWEEDLTEFIEGYVVNVRELLDLIELYKRENQKISTLVERIYGMLFVRLEQQHPITMSQLMASVVEQKKTVFTEFLDVLAEISQSIFTVYDNLGSNVRKMGSSWEQYLHKIDKLLRAAIFRCTLNTLQGVRTVLENAHSSPVFIIEILLNKEGAVYEPTVDAVEHTLRRLIEEVCLTIKPIPSMSRRYLVENGERSFYLQLLEHYEYAAISGAINETIDDTVLLLRTYQAKWNVFRPFWCVDKAAFIERFRLSAMTSDAFQKNIEKFEELQNQLSTQGDFIVCRSVEIDALKLKYALTSHIGEWQTKYVDLLKCIAYGKIIDFNNVLKTNVKELRHEPKEVHELNRLEERYQQCFEELPAKEEEIAIILKFFVVLEKYVFELLPEAYELRRNIDNIWVQYQADLREIREQIENYQDQFKLSMTGAADALKVDALEMLKMLRQEMQPSEDSSSTEAFEAIELLMTQLELLESRERNIGEQMRLLGIDYVRLPALQEIRSTLENLRLVWGLIEEWRNVQNQIMSENYLTVNEAHLCTASTRLRQTYESVAQCLTGKETLEAFVRVGEEISQFTVTVTIICAMRSSFLQSRHWDKVRLIAECETCDEQGVNSSDLTVSKLRLYRFEDELLTLCYTARMEHEVEKDLNAVALGVRPIEFKIRQPISADVFPDLQSPQAYFNAIADNVGIINRLRSSPHRHPFQSLLDYWEHTLGLLEEMLEVLVQMESECRTLFELYRFSNSNGGLSELKDFNEGFRDCFTQYCELMRYISSSRLVEDICPVGQEYIAELEIIRKRIIQQTERLQEILEEQRQMCPRFYLLSDKQLINLLSQSMYTAFFEKSLAVMFENVVRLHLPEQEKPSSSYGGTVCGVYTNEKEYIPFTSPLFFASKTPPQQGLGNAAQTVSQVEHSIRDTLQDLLSKCHAALRKGYFRRVESGWLRTWPLQLCLKSAELQHTLHTRNALVQCKLLGHNKPLKMLRTLQAKLFQELMASARCPTDDRWQRKKLNDLLIVELNARDLIQRLCCRPELHGLNSFEWVSQLQSNWNPSSRRCTIQLLDACFSYGYECKRSAEPMLLTPTSEKARMATICAIKAKQIPLLLATSGASCGRRVLLDSLAHTLGVFLLTLECNESMQVEAMLRMIVAMKHIGGWLAFVGLERVTSIIRTQICDNVRKTIDGQGNSAKKLVARAANDRTRRFQLFALSASSLPMRMVTETFDRTLFRPVVLTTVDRVKVLQSWLWLASFDHSAQIAKLISLFLNQMKLHNERLTEQGFFSMRRLRQVIENVQIFENTSSRELNTEKQTFIRSFLETYSSCISDADIKTCRDCLTLTFASYEEQSKIEEQPKSDQALRKLATGKAHQMHFNLSDRMMEKVMLLHRSLLNGGFAIVVTGGPATGKSAATRIALSLLSQEHKIYRVIPNTLRKASQPTQFDQQLLDRIISKTLHFPAGLPLGRKCLIFDSVPAGEWIDCVARIPGLDYRKSDFAFPTTNENHTTPASHGGHDVKVIVECVGPLNTMTPSLVSRFTLVHIDRSDLRWEDLIAGWLEQKEQPFLRERLGQLISTYFASLLYFRRGVGQAIFNMTDVAIARTFCCLCDGILASLNMDKMDHYPFEGENDGDPHKSRTFWSETLAKLFFFCSVWSIGGSLDDEASRSKYDLFLREHHPEAGYPAKGTVFHYYVDILEGVWRSWQAKLAIEKDEMLNCDPVCYRSAFIRTPQTMVYEFLTLALMKSGKPVVLGSESTVGKTALLAALLADIDPARWSSMRIALTQKTTPLQVRSRLRSHAMKIMKDRLYPEGRKQMVCFLDDLHTVQSNLYALDEFVRGFSESAEWYDEATLVRLEQCQMVAAMRLHRCNTGVPATVQSLLNKCHLLVMTPLPEDQLGHIFTTMIQSTVRLANGDAAQGPVFQLVALATIDFVGLLARRLPPTPARLHYQFTLKTIASIVRSVCSCLFLNESSATRWKEKSHLLRMWIHECYRETWDRLERTDHRRFYELFNETISGHFEMTLHGLCPNNQSPIFMEVLRENGCKNPYDDVRDTNQLIAVAEGKWNENTDDFSKQIIIHREAVEHATKVLRTTRLPHVSGIVLMGRPGSGRTVVCQLAVRLSSSSMVFHRINVRARDEPDAIEGAFLKLFQSCLHHETLVMINLDDIVEAEPNERLMELLSGIVSGEELPVLFYGNGGSQKKKYTAEDTDEVVAMDWIKVRANLHLVICLPLETSAYRTILGRYPSLAHDLTVDCVYDWTETTLLEISKKYLLKNVVLNVPIQGVVAASDSSGTGNRISEKVRRRESLVQSTEERLQLVTYDLLFRLHYTMQTETALLTRGEGKIIVPCCWYFELLNTFERVLRKKRKELQLVHRNYHVGIERIEDATLKVAKLSEALEQQQREIALFQEQLDAFLLEISKQTHEADEQTEEVSVKRVKIGAEELVCRQLSEMAGADLQQAMPALNAAVSALDSLNKKDMNEIKSYSRPPIKVELVMEAVMILLGKEPTWAEAKRQLGEQKFLDTLKTFDRNSVSERTLKTIGAYVRNPELEPDKVGVVSKAAKSLVLWVRAIENYGKVYRYVGPKIRKLENANSSLLEKQNALAAAEHKLLELSERLIRLRSEFDDKTAQKHRLEEAARQMTLKLERARNLVGNLGGEHVRWLNTKENLEASYTRLIGDALLATGFLTYLGPADMESRANFLSHWLVDLETLEIAFTKQFSLTEFFYDPRVLIRWHENGLPPDDFSAENATILLNSTRVALIVDPQQEATRWFLAELDATVKLVDFDDDIWEPALLESFQQHVPLIVDNINPGNVSLLDDVFIVQEASAANCENCRSDKRPYNRTHSLYLVSREPLLLVGSMVKRINQLSFVLRVEGLEMMMLGLLVETENPSLEERKNTLRQTILSDKQTLTNLEEQILRILNESQTPLLENEELYQVLESARDIFHTVSGGLQEAETASLEIEASREVYRTCASRAALLFLVLGDLQWINTLYRYSLEWYKTLFLLSLERSGRVQHVAERKRRIDDYHTYNVFRIVSRGLFVNDRKVFAFYLCIRLLFAEEMMSQREFRFLVNGAGQIDRHEQMENPCRGWLTDSHWDQLTDLDRLPGFHGLVESFVTQSEDWKRWYLFPEPEKSPLPGTWEVNLKTFQKYLVIRCLRLDRIENCITDFTRDKLGEKFINPGTSSLEEVFHESSSQTLILLFLRGDPDPLRRVKRLRQKIHPSKEGGFKSIKMTEKRLDSFIGLLRQSIVDEGWLYVSDCHLSEPCLKQLPHVVALLKRVSPTSSFRLWLSTKASGALPVSVLQNCIKLAYEAPMGIKYHMGGLYEELGEARFKKSTSAMKHTETAYKRLLFSLSFMHGLLIERGNFQQLGWLEPLHFVSNDFSVAETLFCYGLKKLLIETLNEPRGHLRKIGKQVNARHLKGNPSNADVSVEENFHDGGLMEDEQHDSTPWQFIKGAVLELCYGAQIAHSWDRRIYEVYAEELFHPRLLASTVSVTSLSSCGGYGLPRDGTYQTYVCFIAANLPDCDGIGVFGQHENANIIYLKSRSDYMLQMLARMSKDPRSQFQSIQEYTAENYERVKGTVSDLLSTLPIYLDYENALRIVNAGTNRTPVCDALLNEVRVYNATLTQIRSDGDCILRMLTGATNEMQQECTSGYWSLLFEALQLNKVPESWSVGGEDRKEKVYELRVSLSDWMLKLRESVQYFQRWTETGQLPAEIELARFTNPQRFLNGVLQHFAAKHRFPFEEVQWSFTVFASAKALERIPIEEGLIAKGLLLENASWDWEKQTLAIPGVLEMSCSMPPVAFRPTRRLISEEGVSSTSSHFLCPLYQSSRRSEDSFILSMPLAVGEDQDERSWIKYNTALLLGL